MSAFDMAAGVGFEPTVALRTAFKAQPLSPLGQPAKFWWGEYGFEPYIHVFNIDKIVVAELIQFCMDPIGYPFRG